MCSLPRLRESVRDPSRFKTQTEWERQIDKLFRQLNFYYKLACKKKFTNDKTSKL